ncbi:hypothetical protein ACQJBY_062625 [Aegilops geniculata]
MAAADRLSALSDDLLQRILSFAPAKEAAASAALSRRWRPLWRITSALNLDSRPYSRQHSHADRFDDFFRHAKAALAGRLGTPPKRLTLLLMEDAYLVHDSWHYYMNEDAELEYDARVAGLLADPAAAALEELRIAADRSYSFMYVLPLASLPCAATSLRVLEIHNCNLEPPPSTEPPTCLAFPCLADLSLRGCTYLQGYLQAVLDAAPALTRLALVDVTNQPPKPAASGKRDRHEESKSFNLPLHLRSPTVTTLVLETNLPHDELDESRNIGIQLDMPSLRSFSYKGFPVKLSLISPAPGLARVDLDTYRRERSFYKCEPAADMLASFSSTRALKLHLIAIEEIISDTDDESGDQNHSEATILPTFPNLKLLEIHGLFKYRNSNTALALATLLRACPALSELRLRLNMASDYHYNRKTEEREAGGPFALSVERFKRLGSMCAEHRDDVELGAVSDLPDTFTNSCGFGCLMTSLRKVTLEFKSKEVNCFQVQLAKFLVENAMVLEEMHVEDGDQFWPDHLCDKLTRWRADALRRKNLPDTAAGFRVYQLANPVGYPRVHY